MVLSGIQERFVVHWGEMGTRWGVNRTMAQVHALLYVTGRPWAADEIVETIHVARSNVSNCVRELQGWGLIRIVHVLGDRRDHFESLSDVWEMFVTVLDERKRREIDPTVAVLRSCVNDLASSDDDVTRARLEAMLDFFERTSAMYTTVRAAPNGLFRMARLGAQLRKLLKSS